MKKVYSLSIAAFASLIMITACTDGASDDSNTTSAEEAVNESTQVEKAVAATGELPPGLIVDITQDGDGVLPMLGQQMTVHYRGSLEDGRVFDESYKRGEPFKFKVGLGQAIPGWDRAMATLSKGAKANLTIPAELAYGNNEVPGIPKGSTLYFEVEVLDITDGPKPIDHQPWSKEGIQREITDNGVEIYTIEKGEGPQVMPGQAVKVHYYGALLDGKKFDSSYDRGEPIEFPLGQGRVIPGWEEAIATMTVGTKAKIVIPPFLAYGERGAGNDIPPNSTLVFDIEIVGAR